MRNSKKIALILFFIGIPSLVQAQLPGRFLPQFNAEDTSQSITMESPANSPKVQTHWKRGAGYGALGGAGLGILSGLTFLCVGLFAEEGSCSQDERFVTGLLLGLPIGAITGAFVGGTIGHAFLKGDAPPSLFADERMPGGAKPLSKGRWGFGIDLGMDHPEPFGYGGRLHYGLTDQVQIGFKGTYMPFAADQGISFGTSQTINFWSDSEKRRFASVLVDTSYLFAQGPAHLFTFHPSIGYEIRYGARKNFGLVLKLGYGYGVHWGENTPEFFRTELVECCSLPDHVHLIRPAIGFQFRQKELFSINYEITESARIFNHVDAVTQVRLGLSWAF